MYQNTMEYKAAVSIAKICRAIRERAERQERQEDMRLEREARQEFDNQDDNETGAAYV